MFSLKSIKIFAGFALLSASSCGFWQTAENHSADVSPATSSAAEETKSAVPFASAEPEVYQAEIVLTNYADGEKSERKIFTWRNGAKLRYDYENKISFLRTGENQSFLIDNGKRIYAASQTNSDSFGETGETLRDFLTVEWLNAKRRAKFENLAAENGLTKFRVILEDAPNAASETFVYVDENLKLPVRQEFYTTDGDQKVLVFSMELRNLKLEADDKVFELPQDFRQVSANEFQKTTRQQKLNSKNERNNRQ